MDFEYLENQRLIPPEPEEVELVEKQVVFTVKKSIQVPGDLENRIDIKEWIEKNYSMYNNTAKNYIFDFAGDEEVFIEDIE